MSNDSARADAACSHPGLFGSATLVIPLAASNILLREYQVVVEFRGMRMGKGTPRQVCSAGVLHGKALVNIDQDLGGNRGYASYRIISDLTAYL